MNMGFMAFYDLSLEIYCVNVLEQSGTLVFVDVNLCCPASRDCSGHSRHNAKL